MIVWKILQQVILPIMILIGLGILLHRSFRFEMNTFSKLLFYYYIPALTFVKIYESKASAALILNVFGFLAVQFVCLYLLAKLVSWFRKQDSRRAAAFSNSVVLTNNGNVGIPVNDLAFQHNALAMSIQMVVLLFEVFVTFTYGIINTSAAYQGLRKSLQQFAKMPVFYCFLLGMIFNWQQWEVPNFIWIPLTTISNGMLSLALVSLGAQIAAVKLNQNTSTVLWSSGLRLIISPLVAFLLIGLFQLQGVVAQALWIASAMPTSRNSAALALEYNNEPEFAAQAVLVSTLLSSVTLTMVVYASQILF